MNRRLARQPGIAGAIRLAKLAALTADEHTALERAASEASFVRQRCEILALDEPIRRPMIVLGGWAGRVRDLRDGRRQILDLILPGELIGYCRHPDPRASASVIALTEVSLCTAPTAEPGSPLAEAYATSSALSEVSLLRQVMRLGRLSALERLADFFLELSERLALSGATQGNSLQMPLTQETIADALGLTSVHVNRTLKALRSQGLVTVNGGAIEFPRPAELHELVDLEEKGAAAPW